MVDLILDKAGQKGHWPLDLIEAAEAWSIRQRRIERQVAHEAGQRKGAGALAAAPCLPDAVTAAIYLQTRTCTPPLAGRA